MVIWTTFWPERLVLAGVSLCLLHHGADANSRPVGCDSVLQEAVARNKEYIVRLLLKNGAQINPEGNNAGNILPAAICTRSGGQFGRRSRYPRSWKVVRLGSSCCSGNGPGLGSHRAVDSKGRQSRSGGSRTLDRDSFASCSVLWLHLCREGPT
jgi:ankyrin repeat protein